MGAARRVPRTSKPCPKCGDSIVGTERGLEQRIFCSNKCSGGGVVKGYKRTPEQRARYRGPKSASHRKALSRAAEERYSDPAERERQSKQQQARWQDPELLARHSEIIKGHWARDPERRFNPGYVNPSSLGWDMIDFLTDAGFEIIIPEVQFGRYRVDALLVKEWVAFEADETHHKKTKQQDELRDSYLMERYDLPVVRLSEEDLDPWLEAK